MTRFLLLMTFAATALFAQETSTTRIGVHGGFNTNFHTPNFQGYTTSTTSFTGAIGLVGQFPLTSRLAISMRATYASLGNATLEGTNGIAKRLHAALPNLELLPTIGLNDLLFSPSLWLWGGLEIGIPLSPTYSIDSSGTTTENNRDLPDPNTRLSLALGTAYDIPLSQRWSIQPELSLRFPLTKVSSNSAYDSWTISQIRLGANLFFSFSSPPDTTLPLNEPYVRARIGRVITITPSGDTVDVRTIKLEDVRYTEYYPLVPYVFFAANSDRPDQYYQQAIPRETGDIEAYDTLKNALSVNDYILPLICRRMKQYPTARLELIGTNDGRGEARKRGLSLDRANALRAALLACGIDSTRVNVTARDLPEKPSAPNDPDGMAENRRVEFRASTPEILEPFQSRVGIERLSSPEVLIFLPDVSSSDPIKEWELTISQAGRTLRTFRNEGTPRPITWKIDPSELSPQQVPIDYVFRAQSVLGKASESSGSLGVDYLSSTRPIQQRSGNKSVQKFSLILFDFDSDIITPDNQRILDLKILPAITPGSTVKIYGYTDRIGEARYNLDLSRRRATAVMNYLKSKRPDCRYETAGYGESLELYDNNRPTGRQLCRTVQVIIESTTP